MDSVSGVGLSAVAYDDDKPFTLTAVKSGATSYVLCAKHGPGCGIAGPEKAGLCATACLAVGVLLP